ncbi:hypothetical protein ACFDR9_004287 [Janthinobacterium sp. CG_23.3]|uniref:beta/gamma crystallin-related protein n=1 Tax=Janthinobacterium sp. CG_23.3 TaxID=3349634 RepID=UPI0038D42562
MNITLSGALLLGAALFGQGAAQAGELSLYTHSNFNGREVTLRGATPDLSELGFNDRASSMRVRSGRWEVCVDADFSGGCTVVEPGEYPTMERFNDQISSVRELGGRDGGRGHGHGGRERHGRRGMLELFSVPDLRGDSTRVVRDTGDFNEIGFNDRASSLQVEEGSWQLCSDADYRGVCRVFEPGAYRDVGRELNGRVSSARLVDDGGRDGRDERGRDDWRGRGDEAPVVLFEHGDMRGRPAPLLRDASNFGEFNFNDKAGSIVVNAGQWEFCEHAEFGGRCVVYGPGRYPRLDGMNKRISSARRVR